MTYPATIEHKIGFDAVRALIESLCTSALGRQHCAAMAFSADYGTVRSRLGAVAEMLAILSGDSGFELGALHDRRALLQQLRVPGTFPSEAELPGLRGALESMALISAFFSHVRQDDGTHVRTPYPYLDAIAEGLQAFPAVTSAIDRIVDRHGEIKDNASPELADIRRSMAQCAASIASAMRRVIASAVSEGYLEADTTPSVRDGRLVIPVAPMYKRKISGIVQGESASGKTFFIEPAEVVEANNRLRELTGDERREIVRILTALADAIRPYIDGLLDGFDTLGIFDFVHAKALYARTVGGALPHLAESPELEWYHAEHPVLKLSLQRHGTEIVPLDITLTPQRRILIISGPNAGGKSVTLKTVAIIQYMAQCGVLPVLYDNSHMGMMEDIFVDIGDDQSIEDDLSTYSSHLRNMKYFISHGSARSLMLIDEFGSGTEPQIGGAIAQALLHSFNDAGMWGVVTTHYHNLKQYAEETPGLVNGSMLYDRQKMQPTFRLAMGQPGSSFAIEIARKTGIPESIISEASEIVGSDYINMDKYLLDIARDRRYWENKRQAIRLKERKIDDTLTQYQTEMDTLRDKRRAIIDSAREEAEKLLQGSNAVIERTIREIRNAQADRERTAEARRRLQADRDALGKDIAEHPMLRNQVKKKKDNTKAAAAAKADRPLEVGDNVVLDGGGTVGTISEISGKNATVIFGQMKTSVKLARLTRTLRKASATAARKDGFVSSQTSEASRERQLAFNTQLDVRGFRADEAVQAVMYFIDDAIQFNSTQVRILHGTGTGALRQYIRSYLATVPQVRNYHDEDVRMGGTGITVVEF